MRTITEQLAQLTQIKNNLKLAIRSKGVTVLDTDGLAVYASKIAEIQVPPISFTIEGVSYQADSGMTWGEWVASNYNTGGFWIYTYSNQQKVVVSSNNQPIYDQQEQTPNDVIQSSVSYILGSAIVIIDDD